MIPRVSDHSLIMINFYTQTPKALHPKPLKLYSILMNHTKFKKRAQEAWYKKITGDPIQIVWTKLKAVKVAIKELNKYLAAY